MPRDQFEVGIVIAHRRLAGPWGGDEWRPVAVLPAVPDAPSGAPLAGDGAQQVYYAGASSIVLHAAETPHYRDNLASGRPSLWVALEIAADDGCRVAAVTADPYEGEALAGTMDLMVESVPMPSEIAERVARFVAAFHVERPFVKRERDPLASRLPGPRGSAVAHAAEEK
ncbi:MAG: DUF3305 domain-containing protein [Acetobacteraceae bacterium]